MPRPVRVEFAGVVYHVTARGNERREFYRDDKDRRRFLEALGGAVEQFGVVVHVAAARNDSILDSSVDPYDWKPE